MSDLAVIMVLSAGNTVQALAHCMLQSRCTNIKTPCFELEREVLDKDQVAKNLAQEQPAPTAPGVQ